MYNIHKGIRMEDTYYKVTLLDTIHALANNK